MRTHSTLCNKLRNRPPQKEPKTNNKKRWWLSYKKHYRSLPYSSLTSQNPMYLDSFTAPTKGSTFWAEDLDHENENQYLRRPIRRPWSSEFRMLSLSIAFSLPPKKKQTLKFYESSIVLRTIKTLKNWVLTTLLGRWLVWLWVLRSWSPWSSWSCSPDTTCRFSSFESNLDNLKREKMGRR